jgi:hypothetical protein
MEPESILPCSQQPAGASLIPSTPSNLISIRHVLLLSSHLHLGLQSGLFPSTFSDQNFVCTWRILFSGMIHRTVRWIVTNISEECSTSIFREKSIFLSTFPIYHSLYWHKSFGIRLSGVFWFSPKGRTQIVGIFGTKSEEVAGDWRQLDNEQLHNLHSSMVWWSIQEIWDGWDT